MSYKIIASSKFKKSIKKLFKKHKSIKNDFLELSERLKTNPTLGVAIGNNCYKIRLAIKSKGKGKSGGARIITYVTIIKETVYLLAIYDKSKRENITDKQILKLIEQIND